MSNQMMSNEMVSITVDVMKWKNPECLVVPTL